MIHGILLRLACRTAGLNDDTMSDYRKGYVSYKGHEYAVTWHPISKDVYVYWGTDRYAGKAYDMQQALDIALSWLNKHAR